MSNESNFSKKKIGAAIAFVLGINAVIGAGTFTMPVSLLKIAGPAGLITIALSALCVLLMGLGFARLSALFPEDGNFYTYVSSWGGRIAGFLTVSAYIIGLIISSGLLVRYVSSIIGVYSTSINHLYTGYIITSAVIVFNFFASSLASAGQTIMFALTILPLVVIGFLCVKNFTLKSFTPMLTHGWSGIFKAIPSSIFAFLGFESIMSMSHIVENPKRNIPIATILTIIAAGITYFLFVGSIFGGVSHELLIEKGVLSEALLYSMPNANWLIHFINVSIILTILGTVFAMTWSLSELLKSAISQVTDNKIILSDILALVLVGLGIIMSISFAGAMTTMFSVIAICIASVYWISLFTLLFKGKSKWDYLLGTISIASASIIVISAFTQLL